MTPQPDTRQSSIPAALWEATIEMPSATRHAVRSVFAAYDEALARAEQAEATMERQRLRINLLVNAIYAHTAALHPDDSSAMRLRDVAAGDNQ